MHVISQNGETAECYYPERFTMALTRHQTVVLIEDGKVYLEEWVEEQDRATDHYKYYHKVIVRDTDGNTISEEIGALYRSPDGTWWIS